MGVGGISIWQLLIILAIVLLLFGTRRLRNIGGDLGGAIKSFKQSMKDGKAEDKPEAERVEEKKDDGVASTTANSEKTDKV